MNLSVCVTDEDYEAWRTVRLVVEADSRCLSVEEMRELDSPDRLLLLAVQDGAVVGSGIADRSDTAGAGFVAPRVLPQHRRAGVGSGLLLALAEHCSSLGLPTVGTSVDDEGSLAFAERFGFVEVDREVEQVRQVGDEPARDGSARRHRGDRCPRTPRPVGRLLRHVRQGGARRLRRVLPAGDRCGAVEHVLVRRPDVRGPARRRGDRLRRSQPRRRPARDAPRTR